jgi:hypothetical protein
MNAARCDGDPNQLTGSDWGTIINDTQGEQPDRQLLFLQELVEENATVAADIAEIGTHTWAIHGVIPVDGDVIMAEFDSYSEARVVLDQLSTDGPHPA